MAGRNMPPDDPVVLMTDIGNCPQADVSPTVRARNESYV